MIYPKDGTIQKGDEVKESSRYRKDIKIWRECSTGSNYCF